MLLLALRETYALNRLSSFKNLRRKGGKCDHRPGRPKVQLRHWIESLHCEVVDMPAATVSRDQHVSLTPLHAAAVHRHIGGAYICDSVTTKPTTSK